MKNLFVSLAALLIATLVLISRSSLEKDAESLVHIIAVRQTCGLTPVFLGYDDVAGRYDFDRVDQQKFAYAYYFAEAESRILEMTSEERTEMCEDVSRSE